MAATIAYQVNARGRDMLWRPEQVTRQLGSILAASALGTSWSTSWRSAPRWRCARWSSASSRSCPAIRASCPGSGSRTASHRGSRASFGRPTPSSRRCGSSASAQTRAFTRAYNDALLRLNPSADPVAEAVSAAAPVLTLVAYPDELAPDAARPGTVLVGSVVRAEAAAAPLRRALARRRPGRPTVYVSLGTFLSAREDVLATIADALRGLDVNAVMSTGIADPRALGPFPEHWHVAPSLAQVAALAACDAVICHGGNNTVMEALTAGVPVLAGPFSSDQFAAAEDLRRGGVGDAFAPNEATADELARRLGDLLGAGPRERARALGSRLRARPGAERAWDLIEERAG